MNFNFLEQYEDPSEERETGISEKEAQYVARVPELFNAFAGFEGSSRDQKKNKLMSKADAYDFYAIYLSGEDALGMKVLKEHIQMTLEQEGQEVSSEDIDDYIDKLKSECEERYSL